MWQSNPPPLAGGDIETSHCGGLSPPSIPAGGDTVTSQLWRSIALPTCWWRHYEVTALTVYHPPPPPAGGDTVTPQLCQSITRHAHLLVATLWRHSSVSRSPTMPTCWWWHCDAPALTVYINPPPAGGDTPGWQPRKGRRGARWSRDLAGDMAIVTMPHSYQW